VDSAAYMQYSIEPSNGTHDTLVPHGLNERQQRESFAIKCCEKRRRSIPFSAFWLRSSVVSVLISLISDTWVIDPHDIKLIFLGGRFITVACYWGSSSVALALHYSMGLAQPSQFYSKCFLWLFLCISQFYYVRT
jgi:hypothetical protein